MGNTSKIDIHYLHDAEIIKNAILSAQYEATRGANNIQLMLYYSIGRYISQNTRLLKQDLPGLRGFSDANLKKMRIFYEEWSDLDAEIIDYNSPVQTDELPESNSFIQTNDLENSPQVSQNKLIANSFIQTNEIQILPFNFPAVDAR